MRAADLAGRARMDRERVHAATKRVGQRRIDHAVSFEAALSAKGVRHDVDSEMRLAARPVSGVALVMMRFVFDVQAFGIESFGQLFDDEIVHAHSAEP